MSRFSEKHCKQGYCTQFVRSGLGTAWVVNLSLTKFVDRARTLLDHEYHSEDSSRLILEGVGKGLIRDNQFSKIDQGGLVWAAKADLSSKDCSKSQVRQRAPREILEVFTLASYKCSPLLNQYRETGYDSEANSLYRGNLYSVVSTTSKRPTQATGITAQSATAKRPNGKKHSTAQNAELGKQQNFPRRGLDTARLTRSTEVHLETQEAQNLCAPTIKSRCRVANHSDMIGSCMRIQERHGLHLLERIHKTILSKDIESPGLSVKC